jgi:hypothetical protein
MDNLRRDSQMEKTKLVVMPGMSSPLFHPRYQNLYATVERGAEQLHFEHNIVYYPGQEGKSSGLVTYAGQLEKALLKCREIRPDWLIGLSSGCEIVVSCLGSGEDWVEKIQGSVLWGPCLHATGAAMFKSLEERRAYIASLTEEPHQTFVSPDYLEATPCISNLIEKAIGNIRIVRGSDDEYSKSKDVFITAEVHRKMQPIYQTEVREVQGLKHSVLRDEITPEQLDEYFDCLFSPFSDR